MIQVQKKWRVQATFASGATITIWLHDNLLPNVLRAAAGISFTADGFNEPVRILISEEPWTNNAVGQTTVDPI